MNRIGRQRVLITGPSLDAVSGVSTHLRQLLDSRLAQDFELMQFQVGSEGRNEWPIAKLPRLVASFFEFAAVLMRRRPDLVHLNPSIDLKSFWRDLVYLLIAKISGQKVIFQVHGGETPFEFFRSGFLQRFLKWVLSLPNAVVVLGEVEREAYERFCNFKRLAVIPNAIDVGPYMVREKLWSSGAVKLVYIGRLIADKGVFETLDALEALLHRDSGRLHSCRFVVAGSGPADEALRKRANSKLLSGHVEFIGPIFGDEKVEFWQQADIFVFPTYHREGLPYTILESLASGTPLITTRAGNIPDAVEHGIHGLLVKPRSSNAVAEAIDQLLTNPSILQQMSTNCRRTARDRFAVDRLAGDLSTLYRETLDSTSMR
jgi:glycosyltransferase involved in cell wall biosynthesis